MNLFFFVVYKRNKIVQNMESFFKLELLNASNKKEDILNIVNK